MFGNMLHSTIIGIILLYLELCSCKCPIPGDENVANIDLSELNGRWFAITSSPVRKTVGKCLHFDISANSTNFIMNFTSTNPLNNHSISWSATGKKLNNEISAYWQMNSSPNVYGPFIHKILVMKSSNFCAMIICTDNNPNKYRDSFGMAWSRQTTLKDNELIYLKEKLYNYIDMKEFKDIENSCFNV